jgi:sn-glycerol 3-phosphate transport system ATP-binding protein
VRERQPDELRREIGYVIQQVGLFPHKTIGENIATVPRLLGWDKRRVAGRVDELLDLIGLPGEMAARYPAQLSGGQRQRVALGRAIIAEARVCLMDEPLSNLDAKLRHEMRTEIRTLQQRLGMTMVYVTHDQTEAMTMADRVVLMRDGRIEQNGTPEELYNRPATAFTARFIGTPPMNLLRQGDHLIGIRPEHIRIVSGGDHFARVRAIEHLGADSIVLCEVDGQPISVRLEGFSKVRPGEDVRIAWEPGLEHWFDSNSEARLETIVTEGQRAITGR